MAEDSGQERTEPASSRRREESRKEGQVARSADFTAALALFGAMLAFHLVGAELLRAWDGAFRGVYIAAGNFEFTGENLCRLTARSLGPVLLAMTLLLTVVMAVGLAGSVLQVGWVVSTKPMMPKFERIDPLSGLKRMFGLESLGNLVTGVLKMLVIGGLAYLFIRPLLPEFPQLSRLRPAEIVPHTAGLISSMAWRIVAAMLAIGGADFLFQWWRHERSMRMTKQEVREEQKEQEGDAQLKHRIRQIQRQAAMRRMITDVPKATVVVTNPTHVAVALMYDPEKAAAPIVLAKGRDKMAERIKKAAYFHGVPVVEEPPLARALLRSAEIGRQIPPVFFQAVAQILALVMRHRLPRPATAPQALGVRE